MPIKYLIRLIMPYKTTFQINDIFSTSVIFAAMIQIAHCSACVWIYLGHAQDHYKGEWKQDADENWYWADDTSDDGIA